MIAHLQQEVRRLERRLELALWHRPPTRFGELGERTVRSSPEIDWLIQRLEDLEGPQVSDPYCPGREPQCQSAPS